MSLLARICSFDFDCIAVDECQDLTPIEALLIAEIGAFVKRAPLLLAGDEAQTVRPTDFEWGWLSDLLHARVGTPSSHQLSANLRSPRRIAELVNRAWDLYSHLEKQERPSGTGYAEIEDDASDQILYCTAAPGAELQELLALLAAREGLAIITLGDTIPDYVPAALRGCRADDGGSQGARFSFGMHSGCREANRSDSPRAGVSSLQHRCGDAAQASRHRSVARGAEPAYGTAVVAGREPI